MKKLSIALLLSAFTVAPLSAVVGHLPGRPTNATTGRTGVIAESLPLTPTPNTSNTGTTLAPLTPATATDTTDTALAPLAPATTTATGDTGTALAPLTPATATDTTGTALAPLAPATTTDATSGTATKPVPVGHVNRLRIFERFLNEAKPGSADAQWAQAKIDKFKAQTQRWQDKSAQNVNQAEANVPTE